MSHAPQSFMARLTVADMEDPVQMVNALNRILAEIGDQLDQLRGVRGTSTIQMPIRIEDADGNLVHGFTQDTD